MSTPEIVERVLQHISEKPWGDYTEADYSIEQWHSACLIHLHDGPPTSKSQCKLPVKTPNGALNRNGVHAAAAALAGARSPLKASPEQKAKAASALRRYYSQLDETPPESLAAHSNLVGDILTHHGVKGMKWGRRRERSSSVTVSDKGKKLKTKGGYGHPAHSDAVRARTTGQIVKKSGYKALSNQELQAFNQRLNLEQQAKRLSFEDQRAGKKFVLKMIGKKAPGAIESGGKAAINSPRVRKTARRGAAAIAALV